MARLTSWQGKVALVTGASSGIGRLLSLRLARAGARLALVARRAELLERLAQEISGFAEAPLVLPCDVAERPHVDSAAERALGHFGKVDVLVNNAGYGHHRRFLDWDVADIERMMRVNYLGTVYWTKALLPQMVERRSGWIVFMASVAGKIGVPDESAYVASKFAMVGLAEALSLEVESDGVHVLTVCPGAIDTEFFDAEALERMPAVARRSMIEPERVVDGLMRALARGRSEVTIPGSIAGAYLVRAAAPALMRRGLRRATLR